MWQRVYQALNYNWSNTLICAIVCVAAPVFQWFFIVVLGYGYLGAAFASSVYNLSYLALQVPHLARVGHVSLFIPKATTWNMRGFLDYLRLMVPGFLIVCAEWWVLELMVLLSGRLHPSEVTLGAFTVTSTLQALALMAWIGLAVASSVEVGRHIGAHDLFAAKRAAWTVLKLGVAMASMWAVALVALRRPISEALTASESINSLTMQLVPATGLLAILDATSNTLSGVCSGLGWQV